MESFTHNNHGNSEETQGKTGAIIIPLNICEQIEKSIEAGDLVDQHWVLKTFQISKKTLSNYLSDGRIPKWFYTTAFNNTKWFFKSRLFGLKNLVTRKKSSNKKAA